MHRHCDLPDIYVDILAIKYKLQMILYRLHTSTFTLDPLTGKYLKGLVSTLNKAMITIHGDLTGKGYIDLFRHKMYTQLRIMATIN